MPREWDATTYDSLVLPHEQWGRGVVQRLAETGLPNAARVMDAGCGTGRDAALLRQRWPKVDLVAVDGSQQMLDVAQQRLGTDRVQYLCADLEKPLGPQGLNRVVDAVVSMAAFHWVEDHDALFENLASVLSSGGTLTSDCGGLGNVSAVNAAIAEVTGESNDEWEFADADSTRRRLEGAGFAMTRCVLRRDPFRIEDPAVLESFLASVMLGSYLADLSESEQQAFVSSVREALIDPVIDYVRLDIDAVRR